MAKPAKVVMKVVSVKGTCEAKHQVGQEYDLSGDVTIGLSGKPGAICPALYIAAYPNFRALKFGGSLPWEQDPDIAHVCCTDPFNPVVVQLRRIREE